MSIKKFSYKMNQKAQDTHQKESIQIYDLSSIRNNELFKKISDKYPPDLYYFCWLGYSIIENKDVGIIFEEYKRKHVEYQACHNLSNIRIKNKVFTLVKISIKKFHMHASEYNITINLTSKGKKVWKLALEDGLWDILFRTSKQFLLQANKFNNYFPNHFFFDHLEYQKKKKDLDDIKTLQELSIEKSIRSKKIKLQPKIQKRPKIYSEKYESSQISSRTNKNTTNKTKKKKFKPIRKLIELKIPSIRERFMFSFLCRRDVLVSLRYLEDFILNETEFDQKLLKLGKNARRSNRRRFTELVSQKLLKFKKYELVEFILRNNNGQNNNRYLKITEKGKEFYKFMQKRIHFPLVSINRQYRAFQRRRVLKKGLSFLGANILGLILVLGIMIFVVFFFLSLEGILWTPINSTSA